MGPVFDETTFLDTDQVKSMFGTMSSRNSQYLPNLLLPKKQLLLVLMWMIRTMEKPSKHWRIKQLNMNFMIGQQQSIKMRIESKLILKTTQWNPINILSEFLVLICAKLLKSWT